MIHLFRALGKPMVLDVGSGAVHALDEIAYDALLYREEHPQTQDTEIISALSEKYPADEAGETVGEIREMIREGLLDTPDDYSDIELPEAGVIKSMCLHAAHDRAESPRGFSPICDHATVGCEIVERRYMADFGSFRYDVIREGMRNAGKPDQKDENKQGHHTGETGGGYERIQTGCRQMGIRRSDTGAGKAVAAGGYLSGNAGRDGSR